MAKAQTKASNKYNGEHYSKIQANIDKNDYNAACKFCHLSGLNKKQMLVNAIRYYIFSSIQSGTWNDDEIKQIADSYGIEVSEIQAEYEKAKAAYQNGNYPDEDSE